MTSTYNQLRNGHALGYSIAALFTFILISLGPIFAYAENSANVGTILFLDEYPKAVKSPSDFTTKRKIALKHIHLRDAKNLYFMANFPQSLADSLAPLCDSSEDCSPQALIKRGNFQFSFFVNNKEVYVESLNFGAGLPDEKITAVSLAKPLFSEKNEDSWGRFLWMRFMHFAGEEALIEGNHELKIEIRPYYKAQSLLTGSLMASGAIQVTVEKPTATEAQKAIQDIAKDSGWTISQDTYDQGKIKTLNKRIFEEDYKQIAGIVVVKNGELLLEQYYNGSNRDSLHNPRSVSKSAVGSIMGLAIADGHIGSVDAPLSEFYSLDDYNNYSVKKAAVTIKDLLTMSSEFDGDDSDYNSIGNEENMYPSKNWVQFALDLPMRGIPKTSEKTWHYFTAGTVILGDMLHQRVPKGLEIYAKTKLFEPLEITQYQWQYTPQGVVNTAGGLQMRALDFAKYGQLYKDAGQYKGKQILPKKWVLDSLQPIIKRTNSDGYYGYLFWHDSAQINGRSVDYAYATGNGGNKIYIFKELPLVVVITAKAYNKPYAHKQANEILFDFIVPAVFAPE